MSAPAGRASASGTPRAQQAAADGSSPSTGSPEQGLGRAVGRTWQCLKSAGSAGATAQELSEAAGYQPSTIAKHLKNLAELGLAEQDGERWQPSDRPAEGTAPVGDPTDRAAAKPKTYAAEPLPLG
ncbi:winged helix-turn-helix domain-containing protein [Streptomyces sp. LN785]|uniref:winged helix-turn-helix domain-containing protein n=1 Tax=Streptomyces sp. LN785 TaxID=3112983 RepID=UPI00371D9EB5